MFCNALWVIGLSDNRGAIFLSITNALSTVRLLEGFYVITLRDLIAPGCLELSGIVMPLSSYVSVICAFKNFC
jgi:hypothetical protein